jgi:hypothetical protein
VGAIKRELERLAETTLFSSYELIEYEFKKAEALGANAVHYAQIVDMARTIAPNCACGNDYFEGIRD